MKRLPTVDEMLGGKRDRKKVVIGDAHDFAAALLGGYRRGKVIEGTADGG